MKRNSVLSVVNFLALIATVVLNYLCSTGRLNGVTVGSLSDTLPTLITPASYAFGIWGVIYIFLGIFVCTHLRPTTANNVNVEQIGPWFLLSCLSNCSWILAWVYGRTGLSVLIILFLLFCLARIVLRTGMELSKPPLRTIVTLWWPFCLYFGWILIASVVNIAAWLVKIGWNGLDFNALLWAITVLILAGALYIYLTWRRNMREAALVGVWAFVAIAAADHRRAPTAAVTAGAVAALVLMNIIVHAIQARKKGYFSRGE